ncbi:MAG: electron transfer flavoprotein subunit alpha/FixB family protein [Candidatus Gastranaerophilales bacterium]|nr:electron transfer flavoprotein subunit alpha/FixB family protein [Candidatus Gastranaerophilales bacterium]
MNKERILIYGELTPDYNIRPVVLELISKSIELKNKINNCKVQVCVIGGKSDYSKVIQTLELHGADEIIICSDEKLNNYNNGSYPKIFTRIAKKYNPQIILIGATYQGKEIASYCAVDFETGLTADCTDLNINDNKRLVSTRPTFGGQLTADILCGTNPQMATVQEHVFQYNSVLQDSIQNGNKAEVIYGNEYTDDLDTKVKMIKQTIKESDSKDVTTARIIVSCGLGACSAKGLELAQTLANKLNAAIAGSREAFEKGYITKSQQIGQTGKTVAPNVYIALGISGANQHLTGIKNSGKIIAVNKDKNAPIFQHADIGIIGDLYEILPVLIEKINL